MRIFFDNNGNLKSFDREIIAATTCGHNLFIYAEFDNVVSNDLVVTVTFRRADGFIIGPLPAEDYLDSNDVLCRVINLERPILSVPGPLELTVRYDYYGLNEFEERVKVSTRALAKVVAHVYDAVGGIPNEDLGLYFLMDRVNDHEQKIRSLEDLSSIEISQIEPDNKKKNKLWFKIL